MPCGLHRCRSGFQVHGRLGFRSCFRNCCMPIRHYTPCSVVCRSRLPNADLATGSLSPHAFPVGTVWVMCTADRFIRVKPSPHLWFRSKDPRTPRRGPTPRPSTHPRAHFSWNGVGDVHGRSLYSYPAITTLVILPVGSCVP